MHSVFPKALSVPQAEPSPILSGCASALLTPRSESRVQPRALSGFISRCGHISPSLSVNVNPARVRLSAAAHANVFRLLRVYRPTESTTDVISVKNTSSANYCY